MSETTGDQVDTSLWHSRAALCELLAFAFVYPTNELVEALSSGEFADAAKEISAALEVPLTTDFSDACARYAKGDAETALHAFRAEYTRMFIGAPKPVVSPYEGAFRAVEEGVQPLLFVNPHSMEVERFINSCGLGRPEGTNEPLDHVATELELLEYLASLEAGLVECDSDADLPEGGWSSMYDRFFEGHLSLWIPAFADAVIAETREPFYRVAAGLLKGFVAKSAQ